MPVANTKNLKEINTLSVLNIIRDKEPISRADIVKESKLAFPTVMRIVDTLIGLNLVIETGKGESGVGRKPILLTLNKDAFYVVGIIIHASLDIVIVDSRANVLTEWAEPANMPQYNFEKQIDRIVEIVKTILDRSGIDRKLIAGVGVGMPGTDFKADESIRNSQFEGWQNDLDVKRLLEERLNLHVHVDNISRTLTYGEIFYGWGQKYKDFTYVMVDFGVSGSIVQNSKLLTGKNNVAGEYGHVSVDPLNGRSCYCGNKGCLEAYISETGIVRTITERLPEYPDSVLHACGKELSFEKVREALAAGDALAERTFCDAGRILGSFLVNMVNIVNPPAIVLGGSVVDAYPGMVEIAGNIVREGVFSNRARKTKILMSLLPKEKLYLGTTTRVILNALNGYAVEKK